MPSHEPLFDADARASVIWIQDRDEPFSCMKLLYLQALPQPHGFMLVCLVLRL